MFNLFSCILFIMTTLFLLVLLEQYTENCLNFENKAISSPIFNHAQHDFFLTNFSI